jgi:hypothetical protein
MIGLNHFTDMNRKTIYDREGKPYVLNIKSFSASRRYNGTQVAVFGR